MRRSGGAGGARNDEGPPGQGLGVSTFSGFVRTWLGAVRSPWLAATSSVCSVIALVQMARFTAGQIDEVSVITSIFLVFGPATVVATLPDATVLWRVASIGVGMHVGPVIHTPMETLSFGAFLDSWGAAFSGDGIGVRYMFVVAGISLPLLEAVGAWVHRGRLAHEASLPPPAWR